MKSRLLTPLVDVLLACFMAILGEEPEGPVITVSTIPELAAALMQDGPIVAKVARGATCLCVETKRKSTGGSLTVTSQVLN